MEKKLRLEMLFLQAKYPQAEIELWCEDEHRLGLQPILRRVWTPIGEQPITELFNRVKRRFRPRIST